MRTVWGYDGIATRTLDSHASQLRVKLRRARAVGFILNTKEVGTGSGTGSGEAALVSNSGVPLEPSRVPNAPLAPNRGSQL
jgi:hypothetical protein